MKSFLAKKEEVTPKWFVADANNQVLGRMAVKVANILRGRHKPIYTPHVDTGDFVVIINAEKIVVTGKKETDKEYMFYSGWRGNEYHRTLGEMREKRPEFIIEHAIKGMLPKTRLGRVMLSKLKIYVGPDHPHAAQQPETLNLD